MLIGYMAAFCVIDMEGKQVRKIRLGAIRTDMGTGIEWTSSEPPSPIAFR